MMNGEEVISMYQGLSELTGQMLACAKEGDWDHLVELESRCADQVQALRAGEVLAPLSGASRERKVRIIHEIMANDRAIRDLASPWMTELSRMLSSTGNERKLAAAYGAGNGL
ncbi:flagellar protein FliT [Massilia solisilvae]|nr:flagellar protein FliT [Massilia solisilvae]